MKVLRENGIRNKDKILMCMAENEIVRMQVRWYGSERDGGSITSIVCCMQQGGWRELRDLDIHMMVDYMRGFWDEGKWMPPRRNQVMHLADGASAFVEDCLELLVPDWVKGTAGVVEFTTETQEVTLRGFPLAGSTCQTSLKQIPLS